MDRDDDILTAKILVVDDDKYIVNLLNVQLKLAGFRNVLSVTDSRKAISEYVRFKPDLLILDLVMPNIDGFMILQSLSELKSQAHNILILTSLNDPEIRQKAMRMGAKDFLNKPFQREQAIPRIRRLLAARRRLGYLSRCNRELEDISRRMNEELDNYRKPGKQKTP
ncbi:MAG: response regulator [Thermodesulfobacteriota bacterium]